IDRPLETTRQLLTARWHLEWFVREAARVLALPLEPGDKSEPPSPPRAAAGSADAARASVQQLMTAYDGCARHVGDLWGRRKTTALGVRVADRISRALVPGAGLMKSVKRTALAIPLMFLTAALLSRGAFLVAAAAL